MCRPPVRANRQPTAQSTCGEPDGVGSRMSWKGFYQGASFAAPQDISNRDTVAPPAIQLVAQTLYFDTFGKSGPNARHRSNGNEGGPSDPPGLLFQDARES